MLPSLSSKLSMERGYRWSGPWSSSSTSPALCSAFGGWRGTTPLSSLAFITPIKLNALFPISVNPTIWTNTPLTPPPRPQSRTSLSTPALPGNPVPGNIDSHRSECKIWSSSADSTGARGPCGGKGMLRSVWRYVRQAWSHSGSI